MLEWKSANNAGIVKSWHNLDKRTAREEWVTAVKDMRAHAKIRIIHGPPEKAPVENGNWMRMAVDWNGEPLQVACCVDQHDTGQHLRHACVRLPVPTSLTARDIEKSTPIGDTLAQLALALEPEEPAFRAIDIRASGAFAHLVWPSDGEEFHSVLADSSLMPLSSSPISYVTVEPRRSYSLKSLDTWRDKLTASGLGEWYSTVLGNLEMVGLAASYLDLQMPKDLVVWQTAAVMPLAAIHGEMFVSLVQFLLDDRLGECPGCGHLVCRKRGPGAKFGNEVDSGDRCRQLRNILAWPLGRGWWLGEFSYVCAQCGDVSWLGKCMRILEPAPACPSPGPFMDSLTAFAESRR